MHPSCKEMPHQKFLKLTKVVDNPPESPKVIQEKVVIKAKKRDLKRVAKTNKSKREKSSDEDWDEDQEESVVEEVSYDLEQMQKQVATKRDLGRTGRPKTTKLKWSDSEIIRFKEAMKKHGKHWMLITEAVGTKTQK